MVSPIEFDSDFRRHFLECLVHFLRGVGQAVRVDVDANAAARTLHVLTRPQTPNALLKVVATARALKFDYVSIDVRHQGLSFARLNFRRLVLRRGRAADSLTPNDRSGIVRCEDVFSWLHVEQGKLARPNAVWPLRQIASFCGLTMSYSKPH